MPVLKLRILNLKIQLANFSRKMDCSSISGLHFYFMFPILLSKIPNSKVCHWESSIYRSPHYFECSCFLYGPNKERHEPPHLLFTTVFQNLFSHLGYLSVYKYFHFYNQLSPSVSGHLKVKGDLLSENMLIKALFRKIAYYLHPVAWPHNNNSVYP